MYICIFNTFIYFGHLIMLPSTQTVLLFGDQSDAFVEGIDYIYKQAEHQPWLRLFLAETCTVLKDETKHWERPLREVLGSFSSIRELSDRFRHQGDVSGLAHGLLVFIMRQSLLLQSVWLRVSIMFILTFCEGASIGSLLYLANHRQFPSVEVSLTLLLLVSPETLILCAKPVWSCFESFVG